MYHNRILEVDPQFKVLGQIDARVEFTDIEASVDLKYDLNGVSFVFPAQDGSQKGSFTPGSNSKSPPFAHCTSFPFSAHGSTDRVTGGQLVHQEG